VTRDFYLRPAANQLLTGSVADRLQEFPWAKLAYWIEQRIDRRVANVILFSTTEQLGLPLDQWQVLAYQLWRSSKRLGTA